MEKSHTAPIAVIKLMRHFVLVKVISGMQKYVVLAQLESVHCALIADNFIKWLH